MGGHIEEGPSSQFPDTPKTVARFEQAPILEANTNAANYAPYQPAFQREAPPLVATGYPTGTSPSRGSAAAVYQDSQNYCWNTDWLFCVLGLLCTPFWIAGACQPLCRRPRWPSTSSKVGWVFNVILSIVLIAALITAVVLGVKAVNKTFNDDLYNGDDGGSNNTSAAAATGTDYEGNTCSVAQETCSSQSDCCANSNGGGLVCTTNAAGTPMCLVKEPYPCSVNADCVCSSGCGGENTYCSSLYTCELE